MVVVVVVLAHLGSPGKRAVKLVCVSRPSYYYSNCGRVARSV